MKKNTWLFIGLLFPISFSLHLIGTETIFEATILCGDAKFNPSTADQPPNFKAFNPIVPWLNYESLTGKNCFVGIGYQNKTYARLSMDTIISHTDQLLAAESITPANSKIILQLKVVGTNDRNITLSDTDAENLLPGSKIIGESFDIVNNAGNVLKEQCYLVAIKKANMSQEELDLALENIFIATSGIDLFQ